MEKAIVRKCIHCKSDIVINRQCLGDVLRYEGKIYHKQCFSEVCRKKKNSKNKNIAEKWEKNLNNISLLSEQTIKFYSETIIKDEIYKIIQDNYIMTVPQYVFVRLDSIYDGTYKGISVPIPPDDLLDMWQQKLPYLNKVRQKNITLGKEMEPIQRLFYDLAILINKYPSYLAWKNKQKVFEEETIQNAMLTDQFQKNQNVDKEENADISDLVDDIFG